MGKQYNKTIKRRRRNAYMDRKKAALLEKGKSPVAPRAALRKPATQSAAV